jgi:serine/threonine protein kinase
VYLLSEYLIGIDFPQAIDPELHPPFSAYQLQFFFASLLLIISYLHKNSVVHRDVQPKNFILKQNGYLALRDLRYCKLIKNRTNSVVGDSFYKDILPAQKAGCRTAWFKGEGWTDETYDETIPDMVITDLSDLLVIK